MLNSDADKKKFETWLSTGLKSPVSTDNQFAQRLLTRLDAQQHRQAILLLARVSRQEKICMASIVGLTLVGVGLLIYTSVTANVFNFLQTVLVNLIDLVLEPSLAGLIIPVAILLTIIAVLWSLIDMVSLE